MLRINGTPLEHAEDGLKSLQDSIEAILTNCNWPNQPAGVSAWQALYNHLEEMEKAQIAAIILLKKD